MVSMYEYPRYAPDGSRLIRSQTVSSVTTARKYLVDINGEFPQVLMEIDPNNIENPIQKTYIWANNQLLAQYDGDTPSPIYFYLHDRLGSVRNVVHYESDPSPIVKVDHSYTYNPYGETLIHNAAAGAVTNDFRFAGYVWDDVIEQYCCYQRWYDPRLARFTGKDPVKGDFAEPLTLHTHLYCLNDPVNNIDPTGKFGLGLWARMEAAVATAAAGAYGFAQRVVGILNYRNWMTSLYVNSRDLLGRGFNTAMNGLRYASQFARNLVNFGNRAPQNIAIDANKLHHLFGNSGHNFEPLLKTFGGNQEAAYMAIETAFQQAAQTGQYSNGEVIKLTVDVAGYMVNVGGCIVNGVARVGSCGM